MLFALIAIALLHTASGRHLMSEQPSSALADRLAALAKDKTVIVTQISCGYLEFADNWIASVDSLDISNWLAVAQDQAALDYLSARQAQCPLSNPPPCSVPNLQHANIHSLKWQHTTVRARVQSSSVLMQSL